MRTVPLAAGSDSAGSANQSLARVKNISRADFIRQYVIPRKPCIMENATPGWTSLAKWTPDFWRTTYGSKKVKIDGKELTMREVIDLAVASSNEHPAPYYRNINVTREYPELIADLQPHPECCQPSWLRSILFAPIKNIMSGGGGQYELFIGGTGRSFPYLHYDSPGAHTVIHQITGYKNFIFFPPSDGQYLYPKPDSGFAVSQIPDVDQVDLAKFPLFKNVTRFDDTLGPGDTLFMPCGWWHTAKMASFSIGLGIDVANESNWPDVLNYMERKARLRNPILAFVYMSYMRLAGFILARTAKL